MAYASNFVRLSPVISNKMKQSLHVAAGLCADYEVSDFLALQFLTLSSHNLHSDPVTSRPQAKSFDARSLRNRQPFAATVWTKLTDSFRLL